jgi:DNA-binding MarR family transcriptional regulator
MSLTIRAKIDRELTSRVGKWFTVREIQDKLRVNPSTLKPLIMKYARENVLKRRKVKGTARSVQFTPAAPSKNVFANVLNRHMPYRNLSAATKKVTITTKRPARKAARRTRR